MGELNEVLDVNRVELSPGVTVKWNVIMQEGCDGNRAVPLDQVDKKALIAFAMAEIRRYQELIEAVTTTLFNEIEQNDNLIMELGLECSYE